MPVRGTCTESKLAAWNAVNTITRLLLTSKTHYRVQNGA
jgi:hypothetical protein